MTDTEELPLALVGVPEEWVADILNLAYRFEFTQDQLANAYDQIQTHIGSASNITNNYAALRALCFYVVHEKKLYCARDEKATWEAYCKEMANMGYGSVSLIKDQVSTIKALISKHGIGLNDAVLALAAAPTATKQLAEAEPGELSVSAKELVTNFQEREGREALQELREATGEPTITCVQAVYIHESGRFLAKVVSVSNDGSGKREEFDLTVHDVGEKYLAEWLGERLKPKNGLVIK